MISRGMRAVLWLAMLGSLPTGAACVKRGDFECLTSDQCVFSGRSGFCEANSFCSFPDNNCDSGRRFGEHSGPVAGSCTTAVELDAGIDGLPDVAPDAAFTSACPVRAGAMLAWTLDTVADANYTAQAEVLYSVDNRTALVGVTFTRIAYCMQLDTSYGYVELDDFTTGDVQDTGIPTAKIFDTAAGNVTIRTNVATLAEATNATGGKLELWPNCYSTGLNGVHDYEDDISSTTPAKCYGSFQFHLNTTTALAFNHWAGSGVDDLGIGSQATGNPDWTFSATASTFTTRRIQAFIIP